MAHLPNGVWIPDAAARQNDAALREHAAELQRMVEDGTQTVLDEWNRALAQVDPELRMVRAKENANAPGLVPGHYHLVRKSEIGPPNVIPVSGPDGEFTEPTSAVFEQLQRMDMWSDRSQREQRRVSEELDRQVKRRREREREERHDEISERWKAASNPGVSMSRAGQWRYRAGAPRSA